MGCEEREYDYCKCVSTSYSIIECDVCDKYVCHEKCDFIKIPEFIFMVKKVHAVTVNKRRK